MIGPTSFGVRPSASLGRPGRPLLPDIPEEPQEPKQEQLREDLNQESLEQEDTDYDMDSDTGSEDGYIGYNLTDSDYDPQGDGYETDPSISTSASFLSSRNGRLRTRLQQEEQQDVEQDVKQEQHGEQLYEKLDEQQPKILRRSESSKKSVVLKIKQTFKRVSVPIRPLPLDRCRSNVQGDDSSKREKTPVYAADGPAYFLSRQERMGEKEARQGRKDLDGLWLKRSLPTSVDLK